VRIEHFPEGASQSFEVGDLLVLDTTSDYGNRVVIGASDPSANTVVGVAAEAATGTANTKVAVWLADEEGEFVIRTADTQALDNDHVGDSYGVVLDTTYDIFRLDTGETTAVVFKVVKLLDNHADVNGRLVVKFLNARRSVFAS
jgi:hypothetical protein